MLFPAWLCLLTGSWSAAEAASSHFSPAQPHSHQHQQPAYTKQPAYTQQLVYTQQGVYMQQPVYKQQPAYTQQPADTQQPAHHNPGTLFPQKYPTVVQSRPDKWRFAPDEDVFLVFPSRVIPDGVTVSPASGDVTAEKDDILNPPVFKPGSFARKATKMLKAMRKTNLATVETNEENNELFIVTPEMKASTTEGYVTIVEGYTTSTQKAYIKYKNGPNIIPKIEKTTVSIDTTTSEEASATSTEIFTTSTEASATSTKASAISTEAPITSTEAPINSTEAPITSTEAPTNSTVVSTAASEIYILTSAPSTTLTEETSTQDAYEASTTAASKNKHNFKHPSFSGRRISTYSEQDISPNSPGRTPKLAATSRSTSGESLPQASYKSSEDALYTSTVSSWKPQSAYSKHSFGSNNFGISRPRFERSIDRNRVNRELNRFGSDFGLNRFPSGFSSFEPVGSFPIRSSMQEVKGSSEAEVTDSTTAYRESSTTESTTEYGFSTDALFSTTDSSTAFMELSTSELGSSTESTEAIRFGSNTGFHRFTSGFSSFEHIVSFPSRSFSPDENDSSFEASSSTEVILTSTESTTAIAESSTTESSFLLTALTNTEPDNLSLKFSPTNSASEESIGTQGDIDSSSTKPSVSKYPLKSTFGLATLSAFNTQSNFGGFSRGPLTYPVKGPAGVESSQEPSTTTTSVESSADIESTTIKASTAHIVPSTSSAYSPTTFKPTASLTEPSTLSSEPATFSIGIPTTYTKPSSTSTESTTTSREQSTTSNVLSKTFTQPTTTPSVKTTTSTVQTRTSTEQITTSTEPTTTSTEPTTTLTEPTTTSKDPPKSFAEPTTTTTEPSTTPTELSTTPLEPSTTPTEPSTTPKEPSTTPEEPSTTSTQKSTTTSTEPSTTSTEKSTTSTEKSTTTSNEPSTTSTGSSTTFNGPSTPFTKPSTFSTEPSTTFTESSTLSLQPSTTSTEKLSTTATETIIISSKNFTTSANYESLLQSTESSSKPFEFLATTSESSTTSTILSTLSTQPSSTLGLQPVFLEKESVGYPQQETSTERVFLDEFDQFVDEALGLSSSSAVESSPTSEESKTEEGEFYQFVNSSPGVESDVQNTTLKPDAAIGFDKFLDEAFALEGNALGNDLDVTNTTLKPEGAIGFDKFLDEAFAVEGNALGDDLDVTNTTLNQEAAIGFDKFLESFAVEGNHLGSDLDVTNKTLKQEAEISFDKFLIEAYAVEGKDKQISDKKSALDINGSFKEMKDKVPDAMEKTVQKLEKLIETNLNLVLPNVENSNETHKYKLDTSKVEIIQEQIPESFLPPSFKVQEDKLDFHLLPRDKVEIREEEIDPSLLPPGFVPTPSVSSSVSQIKNSFKGHYKFKPTLDDSAKDKDNEISDASAAPNRKKAVKFGSLKGSSVGTDPISELLKGIEILDVAEFLPVGYKYGATEPPPELEYSSHDDLLDILREKQKETSRPVVAFPILTAEDDHPTSAKPELKFSRFQPSGRKSISFSSSPEVNTKAPVYSPPDVTEPVDQAEQFDFSDASIFNAILSGGSIKLDPKKILATTTPRQLSSTTTTAGTTTSTSTTTTTTTTTTTPPRSTTPGTCGEYCRLAGTIQITSGIEWQDSLCIYDTKDFMETSDRLARLLKDALEKSRLLGHAPGPVTIEAFTHRPPLVLVDFILEFHGLVFDVNTLDLREALVAGLREKGGAHYLGGFGLNKDMVDFYVLSTERTVDAGKRVEVLDIVLPDWAWVVIFGGAMSVLIVATLGCAVGFNRWKHNRLLRQQYLSAKTLAEFKSLHVTSALDNSDSADTSAAPLFTKRTKTDIWTLQRNQESTINTYSRQHKLDQAAQRSGLPSQYTIPSQKVKDWQSTAEWRRSNFKRQRTDSSSTSSGDSDSGISSQKVLMGTCTQTQQGTRSLEPGCCSNTLLELPVAGSSGGTLPPPASDGTCRHRLPAENTFNVTVVRTSPTPPGHNNRITVDSVQDIFLENKQGAGNRSRAQLLEHLEIASDSDEGSII